MGEVGRVGDGGVGKVDLDAPAAVLDKEGERVAAFVPGQQVIELAGALRVLRLIAGAGQDDF